MGGGSNDAPEMSDEEKGLLATQTKVLEAQLQMMQQQDKQFQMLSPFLFKELGLKPILDEKGNIKQFEEIADEIKPLREKSEKLLLERSVAALEGRLPVSAQLQQELETGRSTLEESLRRSLGPDFIASTGGSKAIADFEREKENILEASRRGDITLGEQLSLAREATRTNSTTAKLANALGITRTGLDNVGGMGSVAAGFSNPIAAYADQRRLEAQFAMNAQQQVAPWVTGLAGAGKLAGTLATAPLGGTLLGSIFNF